jgi:hypothetical protein
MADFNATFAVNNNCTLLNVGGVSALCDCCQTHGGSWKHIRKDVERRGKRSFVAGANACSNFDNALVCDFRHHDCRGGRH